MATNDDSERMVNLSGAAKPAAATAAKQSAAAPAPAAARADRADADFDRQNTDGTALTMEERKAFLRSEWTSDILPNVEDEPGWHYCWLSTTSSSDPIYRRLQLGYELVPYEQMKKLGIQNVAQSGEFAGCVAVNEMILARIPAELFQEIMTINHYEKPLEEEELLKANAVRDDTDSGGQSLGRAFGEGINNLARRSTRRPVF